MEVEKIEPIIDFKLFLSSLVNIANECAKLYQYGDISRGSIRLIDLIDNISIVASLLAINVDLQDEEVNIDRVNEKLRDVTEAFENNDFILVGDLIEYELIPLVNKLYEKL